MGRLATSPLPSRGSPSLHSGGPNQKRPTSGQIGYISPAGCGAPNASKQGAKAEEAHKWAVWLHHPCRLRGPQRLRLGDRIRRGPQLGRQLHHSQALGGSPTLQIGVQKQKRPISGPFDYITLVVPGFPTASEWGGGGLEETNKWADWLHHPCRLGGSQRFGAWGKIRKGTQLGRLATSPLLSSGSPTSQVRRGPRIGRLATSPLPSRGLPNAPKQGTTSEEAQKWVVWLHLTTAFRGVPNASEWGTKSKEAHNLVDWLHRPCPLGGPEPLRTGDKIGEPQLGRLATSSLPSRGYPTSRSEGQITKSPTSGHIGYMTPAVYGVPIATAGNKIKKGPQLGGLATSSQPSRGS